MRKKILIIGGSSGIGKEIAIEKIKEGHLVTLIARREKELKSIADSFNKKNDVKVFYHKQDVEQIEKAESLFKKSIKSMEGLDEIFYCSGALEKIELNEYDTKKDIKMINVNLTGCVSWLNLAADYFSNNREGIIVGISSIAGDRGRVGNPVYNASKAGMTTYLEALRNRLSKKGIQVVTVRPGFIDTDMTKGMKGLFWLITANTAAKIIIENIKNGKDNFYIPARWRFVSLIIQHIPSFIFKKLNF